VPKRALKEWLEQDASVFPQLTWWLIEIAGQMALLDPPMTAGVFTSFLVWQLRPIRDCEKALAVPLMRNGCESGWNVTRRDLVQEAVAVSLMMIHGRIETPISRQQQQDLN
jgi:hypothetical protein